MHEYLAGRAAMYRLLQNIFGNEPSCETIEHLKSPSTRIVVSAFANATPEFFTAHEQFFAAIDELSSDEQSVRELNTCFTRLFVGPGDLEAQPWESLYLGQGSSLFQPNTLEVRKFYVSQGFIPKRYPQVADDHIGLELDFMANLATKACTDFETGDLESMKKTLATSAEFLQKHLLTWIPSFSRLVCAAKHSTMYKPSVKLLKSFIELDVLGIAEI